MNLPARAKDWPPEAVEELREQAAIEWANRGAKPGDEAWTQAWNAAIPIVRAYFARRPEPTP